MLSHFVTYYIFLTHRAITKRNKMQLSVEVGVKNRAVNQVLERLGQEMFEIVRNQLHLNYAISLEEAQSEFTIYAVPELHYALSKLLGVSAANLLVSEIDREVERLLSEPE